MTAGARADAGDTVVVLESFGPPHARTNAYLTQLVDALPPAVRPVYFSWGRALAGRYDVFHVHWPEVLLRDRTAARRLARAVLYVLVLARLRLGRRALVRTLHNPTPHEALSAPQRLVVRLSDRWTTVWIRLNDVDPAPRGAPSVVAPIGHSRARLAGVARCAPVRGRLLHFGLLRRYKGVEGLLRAFAGVDDDELTLRVVGEALDATTAGTVAGACRRDRRVSAVTRYVPEDELVAEIQASELVVLPYTRFTNSSSLVLALSLDRPVLVPSVPATERMAAEVGPGWVLTYKTPLEAADLVTAITAVRGRPGAAGPDLSGRDWADIGARHAAAFTAARRLARGRRRDPGAHRPYTAGHGEGA